MLKEGQKFPEFCMPNQNEEQVCLNDFAGKIVVLYYYPKDSTPGCTREACGFRDAMKTLSSNDVVVLGVSKDSAKSHQKFIEKQELNFDLLTDEGKQFAEKIEASNRSTFLIDREGNLVKQWQNVKVSGHVVEVVEELSKLNRP
jgi:peroxiredoxin Q/BCP